MSRKKTSRKNPSRKTLKQTFNPTLLWVGLGIILVALAGVFLFNPKGAATAEGLPREVSVTDASAMREAGAFILDVREPDEWNESQSPARP